MNNVAHLGEELNYLLSTKGRWGTPLPAIIIGLIIYLIYRTSTLRKNELKFWIFGLKWLHRIHDAQFCSSYYATMNSFQALFLVAFPALYRMQGDI